MASPPSPIRVSPDWRTVPRSRPVVEMSPRPLWREALAPERPVISPEWREVPAQQTGHPDYCCEVPTGRYAGGPVQYCDEHTRQRRARPGPAPFLPGVAAAGMLIGTSVTVVIVALWAIGSPAPTTAVAPSPAPAPAPTERLSPPLPTTRAPPPYTPRPPVWRCP